MLSVSAYCDDDIGAINGQARRDASVNFLFLPWGHFPEIDHDFNLVGYSGSHSFDTDGLAGLHRQLGMVGTDTIHQNEPCKSPQAIPDNCTEVVPDRLHIFGSHLHRRLPSQVHAGRLDFGCTGAQLTSNLNVLAEMSERVSSQAGMIPVVVLFKPPCSHQAPFQELDGRFEVFDGPRPLRIGSPGRSGVEEQLGVLVIQH